MLRATALTAAVTGAVSCATSSSASAAHEYAWALQHGGCECGPIAYAPGSSIPYWGGGQTIVAYVRGKIASCASRQFVVVAFGDGTVDLTGDLNLARARAAPIVRRLSDLKDGRLDTLVFAGPHIAHPSTLEIVCPTDRLPAQNSF